jgi:hypothetical protein
MKRQELLVGGAFETETARLRDLAPRIERTGEGVDPWVVEHGRYLAPVDYCTRLRGLDLRISSAKVMVSSLR